LAFAAGGQARGKEVSLLDQWLQRWQDRGERLREVVEQRVDQRRFTSEEQPEAPSYIETVTLALGPGGRSVPAVQAIQEAASSQELETIRRMLHLSPLSAADRLKPLEQLKREMVLALTDV
jgi:hypothetical protein